MRSRAIKRRRAARRGGGGDRDSDGVPDALDIASRGRLILDNLRRSARARTSQAEQPGGPLFLWSGLRLFMNETVNANAPPPNPAGSLQQNIDGDSANGITGILPTFGRLGLSVVPGGPAELDCRGLSYCSPGGTGMTFFGFASSMKRPFPGPPGGPLDEDGDGLGDLGTSSCEPGVDCSDGRQLTPGATSSEITTGNEVVERVTPPGSPEGPCAPIGATLCYSNTLQFVFATVPALVAYSDTAGNGAPISYPISQGGLGTPGNGFPVAPGANGDIVVTLTFWRPQRRPIPPNAEGVGGDACVRDPTPCEWVDIGDLDHTAGFGCLPELSGDACLQKHCPEHAFTIPGSEDNLTKTTLFDGEGAVRDSAPSAAARPGRTFTYTVNLSDCRRDPRGFGVKKEEIRWDRTGETAERELFFQARDAFFDNATQAIYFRRSG